MIESCSWIWRGLGTAWPTKTNRRMRRQPSDARIKRRKDNGTTIFPGRIKGRRKRDAPAQEWNAQERQRRQGGQGQEPQAGDRHRPVGSPQKGEKGPAQKTEIQKKQIQKVACRSGLAR